MSTHRTRAAASRLAQALNAALAQAVESTDPTKPPHLDDVVLDNLQQTFRIATGFELRCCRGYFYAHEERRQA